jgi:signal transduction histidine kinase
MATLNEELLEAMSLVLRKQGAPTAGPDDPEANSWLRQFQKMEALGRLSAGIAHDFNRLLTIIMGHGDLLLHSLKPGQSLRSSAEEIVRAASSAARLTSQILSFSRKHASMAMVVDLNQIVTETTKLLTSVLPGNIETITMLAPALGRVRAQPGQVEQVLMNLVINARDALPRGGRITILTANVNQEAPLIHLHGVIPPGQFIRLVVTDTGEGMDAETKEHVFDLFYTTKAVGKGTGLGLSIVRDIVQESNGHIVVTSELKKGSTFAIYLPRIEEDGSVSTSAEWQIGSA